MKSKIGSRLRWIVAVTFFVGLFGQGSLARAAPAAEVAGNKYTSPTYPYSMEWSDDWFLVDEASTPTYDSVEVADGITDAQLVGAAEMAGNAAHELAAYVGFLRTDPKVSNLEQQVDAGELMTEERAFKTYTFTYALEEGTTEVTTYLEGRAVEPGVSVVLFITGTPSEFYAAEQPLISDLAASISVGPPGAIGSGFASDQWRVSVVSTVLNVEFDKPRLKAKNGKVWVVVIADVTNWSDTDAEFSGREMTLKAGIAGKRVKPAPSSTRAASVELAFKPVTDKLSLNIAANTTERIVLVYSMPEGHDAPVLSRGDAFMTLEEVKEGDPNVNAEALADPAALPAATEGELVSASDGRTVRILLDGETKSVKTRLLGVKPPAKGTCFADEGASMLGGLSGSRVLVEEDPEVTSGSTPRYIWLVNDDGTRTLLNDQLISAGMAKVDDLPQDAHFGAWLRSSQSQAEADKIGLWSGCTKGIDTNRSGDGADTASPTPTAKTVPTKTATARATASAEATSTPKQGAGWVDTGGETPTTQTVFDITLRDINYSVTELVVPANSIIAIRLENTGEAVHTFNIDELNVHSGDVAPGDSRAVVFSSGEPGTYTFYCSSPGHKAAGMVGKLIVVDEAAS